MSEQQFTDFFDPEIQKIVSEDGCSIYRMKNVTGEGVITRYEILPGIELFYNDFHMSDGQNQNKLPHADVLEINHCREGRFECEFANLIVFIGAWGSGAKTTLVALTVSYILRYIKLVRTRTDMEMGKAYVMCAIASGASKLRIMLIHIFPNLIAEMIRFLCLSCADMILAITGFSFIGLGLGDNVVDWGSMILDARGALVLHPTMILYPIGAVILSTLCFNAIGRQLTTKEAE